MALRIRILPIFILFLFFIFLFRGLMLVRAQTVPFVVHGYVYMPDGSPAQGATVKVSCSESSKSTTTRSDGYYQVTLSISRSQTVTVRATKDGLKASKSFTADPSAGGKRVDLKLKEEKPRPPPRSSVSLRIEIVGGAEFFVGDSVEVTGVIKPAMKALIRLIIVEPDGDKVERKVYSDVDGRFGCNFTVSEAGEYTVYAVFPGNEKYSSGTSNMVEFTVRARVSLRVSPPRVRGEGNFSLIEISGYMEPNESGVPVRLFISFDNSSWLLFREVNASEGKFVFSLNLPIYGTLFFKLVVPETELISGSESEVFAVNLKSPEHEELNVKVESLRNQLESYSSMVEELKKALDEKDGELKNAMAQYQEALREIEELKNELVSANAVLEDAKREADAYKSYFYFLILVAILEAVLNMYLAKKRSVK